MGLLAEEVAGKFFFVRGTHISAMEMKTTEGVSRKEKWTPRQIADNLDKIMQW